MTSAIKAASNVQKGKTRRKKRFGQHNLTGYLFVSPWLLGFFVFTFVPIAASLALAFTNYSVLSPDLEWVGLANFKRMLFEDLRYWRSVKATFYYAFASVPLRLAFALSVAMLLNSTRKMVSAYRAIYYAPSIVGASVAVAVMWRQMLIKRGPVNALLGALFGVPAIAWLGDPRTAIWTLILLAVWQFGSPMLIFLAGLRQIPVELYESASIDGAGGWAKFTRITLPMLTPVIFFNLVMQVVFGLTVFTEVFIVTNGLGSPLDTTLFYALYLYQRGFTDFQMGYSAGMAWILLLVVALCTYIIFKTSSHWVYYESERGK
jgi:multiple sugar transport system permease protein